MTCVLYVTVLVLLAAFITVNASPSCPESFTYVLQNFMCGKHGFELHGYLKKIAVGEITYNELAEKIANDCDKANSTSCYNQISRPITGLCNEDESMQDFRNGFKVVYLMNEYICQNSGQKYLDFVKGDGAQCLFNDRAVECINVGKNTANLTEPLFKDENVCKILEVVVGCMHHYDDCANQNVGEFNREFLLSVREKFKC